MKTVLVVDDDKDIRELIVWKLKQAGYATLAEADGEAGLAAASGASPDGNGVLPDLVLLDWTMPKMDGIYVCALMRTNPVTAHVPVILLTAKAQESEMERGFTAGADDYIVKPFSPREMLSRVEAVLGRNERQPAVRLAVVPDPQSEAVPTEAQAGAVPNDPQSEASLAALPQPAPPQSAPPEAAPPQPVQAGAPPVGRPQPAHAGGLPGELS